MILFCGIYICGIFVCISKSRKALITVVYVVCMWEGVKDRGENRGSYCWNTSLAESQALVQTTCHTNKWNSGAQQKQLSRKEFQLVSLLPSDKESKYPLCSCKQTARGKRWRMKVMSLKCGFYYSYHLSDYAYKQLCCGATNQACGTWPIMAPKHGCQLQLTQDPDKGSTCRGSTKQQQHSAD